MKIIDFLVASGFQGRALILSELLGPENVEDLSFKF